MIRDGLSLAALTQRTIALVAQLRKLARFEATPQEAIAVRRELDVLATDIGDLTTAVQDREARRWSRDTPPATDAPPSRPRGLPLSTEVGGVAITKCPPRPARGIV